MITINNKILRGKKAQAAMEFLTTYGWAILILIIVIVALANLGVFRSPNTPNTCSVSAPFACSDVKINSSGYANISLQANNVGSASIVPGSFVISAGVCSNAALSGTINGNGVNYISLLSCGTAPTKGNKEIGQFDIMYALVGSGTSHTTAVRYSATVE